ncbi:hypothetical protein XBKQ1_2340018 [Xenorhabdus bovienii str. kraussei Quebec]|uniref:Uncharacterized protein n=7 Tax=Xenorhabdus bovienii TaxID=40576 RepID=A0A077P5P0_XENBV|nr:hypothetical protein XBJ1_4183 [Xenorhabdus bovienii SS-2004]CDG88510.1 hypothetical protein XBFFR1_2130045 [Xenorhabdus bovienii str. feltiae France]CDG93498.1 hypothetical protein XBFFL1_2550018 [Xenorhabdus bovienii str. feltiae Florida]CDH03928.1 hypothetical protein XBFM1_90024 [Xenorhabdus bovienii str. feltiae Moldova]CDH08078.1 hypothetical protein XBO1_850064 [Xenorhabdus bovienii str. oregonense]CDH19815.1 hypothetical protein XBKQ1_2340018 [Xenorhabdus bovienii str. kraussei Queb
MDDTITYNLLVHYFCSKVKFFTVPVYINQHKRVFISADTLS